MQGESVTRIAGWDTHGLPVEIEVEKELKLSGKKDIERFGVAEFNARARKSVFKYQSDWEKLSDRIGYWLDYEHPYITCSNEYIETVWWLLRRLHERDLLYRGHRVLPYCPRCGTVLSSHELALGYEEVTTNSVYVTFPLEDDPSRQLLVWTTTPWTLLSNVAVAVHPELEYGEYQVGDRRIILATAARGPAEQLGQGRADASPSWARSRTFPGSELAGLRYRRPLDVVPLPGRQGARVWSCRATSSPPRTARGWCTWRRRSARTTTRPAWSTASRWCGRSPPTAPSPARPGPRSRAGWSPRGRPTTSSSSGSSRRAAGTSTAAVRAHLSALLALLEPADLLRARLLVRAHVGREGADAGAQRAGGLASARGRRGPLRRMAGEQRRLGALARPLLGHAAAGVGLRPRPVPRRGDRELRRAGRALGQPLPDGLRSAQAVHRRVRLARARAAGTMRRTPEVIDTWFDSGSMPYAQWHYPFEHEEEFAAHFPADFICEGVDQTRGWFYSLLAIATHGVRQPGLPARDRERAGPRRRGPEDVEEPRQRGRIRGR